MQSFIRGIFRLVAFQAPPTRGAVPQEVFRNLSEAAHHAAATIDRLAGGKKMPDNDAATELSNYLKTTGQFNRQILPALSVVNRNVVNLVNAKKSFSDLPGNERSTLHNIVLAWLLTLPVCVLLGATTFAAGLYTMFKLFGLK